MKMHHFSSAHLVFNAVMVGFLLFVSANSFGLGCHWECWDTHSPVGWQCVWVCD